MIDLQVYRKYCRTSSADLLNHEMMIANAVANAIDPEGSGHPAAAPVMIKKGKGVRVYEVNYVKFYPLSGRNIPFVISLPMGNSLMPFAGLQCGLQPGRREQEWLRGKGRVVAAAEFVTGPSENPNNSMAVTNDLLTH